MNASFIDVNRESVAGYRSPRLLGDVLHDMLLSNSPLAVAYRERMAAKVSAEKGGEK